VLVDTLKPGIRFPLSTGRGFLPEGSLHIKYARIGDPKLPAVLLCPSMSNSCFAIDSGDEKGWWNGVVGHGPQFGIDLDKFHVICGAPMGSPFGSTSPLTNKADGTKWRCEFPQITPQDMAHHQKILLDELGIDKVFAVVGGSMGGMQSIQFAALYPEMYDRFVSVASTAHTSPGTVALRSVQRNAVRCDPDFNGGNYEVNPTMGMGIARMFGTICYRSPTEFDQRFDWYPSMAEVSGDVSFEVERYLQHQARKFTKGTNYDANCYLLLSQAMDMMDIGQGVGTFEDGCARIPTSKEALLLSYSTDKLTPAHDLERLASVLGSNGLPVHFEILDSRYGHDAFLIEGQSQPLCIRLNAFLGDGVHGVRQLVKDIFYH